MITKKEYRNAQIQNSVCILAVGSVCIGIIIMLIKIYKKNPTYSFFSSILFLLIIGVPFLLFMNKRIKGFYKKNREIITLYKKENL